MNMNFCIHQPMGDSQLVSILPSSWSCFNSKKCAVVSHVLLISISLLINDVKHRVLGLSVIGIACFVTVQILCPFLNWIVFLLLSFEKSLHVANISFLFLFISFPSISPSLLSMFSFSQHLL